MKRINNKALILMLSFFFMSFTVAAQDILGTWLATNFNGVNWFLTFKDGRMFDTYLELNTNDSDSHYSARVKCPGTYRFNSNVLKLQHNIDRCQLISYKVTVNGQPVEVSSEEQQALAESLKGIINMLPISSRVSFVSEDKFVIRGGEDLYTFFRVQN